ncbi:MAG: hypothetical protein E6772_14220 [Dysgonomonas sp.]|nr:hypothetical protein [Dysgonomonas sp.]
MSDKAVIVIPVYKSDPNEYELISFRQVLKVLKEYVVVLAVPQDLDVKKYQSYSETSGKELEIEYFDK